MRRFVLSVRWFPHPLTALTLPISIGQTTQFVVLVHRHIIVDDPPVVLKNRGRYAIKVVVLGGLAATRGLFRSEPNVNIDAVLSDCSAAENREPYRSRRVVWSGEQSILQPWSRRFVLVCFQHVAEAPVVISVAGLKAVEFLGKSFA